jgi:predicted PurR-regulated permease PerM
VNLASILALLTVAGIMTLVVAACLWYGSATLNNTLDGWQSSLQAVQLLIANSDSPNAEEARSLLTQAQADFTAAEQLRSTDKRKARTLADSATRKLHAARLLVEPARPEEDGDQ